MRNLVVSVMLAFAFLTGCASNRVNLVDNGTVRVERVNSQRTTISKIYVYQERNALVISGRVKRNSSSAIAGGGHVDITVLDQDEQPIKNTCKSYFPRKIRRSRTSSFSVSLPLVLSKGSTIKVVHHNGASDEDQACGKNT